MWFVYLYLWLYKLHTLLKLFRPIYLYSSTYSFAILILWTRGCLTTSSHAQISCSHKSKNTRDNDEDLVKVTFTPCNLSNNQFLNTFTAPAGQSCNQWVFSNHDELQMPSFRQTLNIIAVFPEKNLYNQNEIGDDDNFCPLPHQTLQPIYHHLRKTALDMNKEDSLSY